MVQPMTIPLGYLNRKTTPGGVTYLQGDIGNLRVTITAEPSLEPSEVGDMVYVARARMTPRALRSQAHRRSPLPGRHPFDLTPAPARVDAEELAQDEQAEPREIIAPVPLTKAAQLRAAADDVLARLGRIPPHGDSLDGAFLPFLDPELAEAMRMLETPLVDEPSE